MLKCNSRVSSTVTETDLLARSIFIANWHDKSQWRCCDQMRHLTSKCIREIGIRFYRALLGPTTTCSDRCENREIRVNQLAIWYSKKLFLAQGLYTYLTSSVRPLYIYAYTLAPTKIASLLQMPVSCPDRRPNQTSCAVSPHAGCY